MNIENNQNINTNLSQENIPAIESKTDIEVRVNQAPDSMAEVKTRPASVRDNLGYLVVMAVSIIWLYVVNNLFVDAIAPLEPYVISTYPGFLVNIINFVANFHSSLFADNFVNSLWAINLALGLSILGNLGLLIWHPRWFLHLMKALLLSLGAYPVYLVWSTFPFVIQSPSGQTAIKVILVTLGVFLVAGFVIEMARFIVLFPKRSRSATSQIKPGQEQTPEANLSLKE